MNPALKQVHPIERRALLDNEARLRKAGAWSAWITIDLPNGLPQIGDRKSWIHDIRKAVKNNVFSVLVRECQGATHFAISSLSGIRPTWHEMQRIKNELAGYDKTGAEVYPPHSELVDDADMFHLWIVDPFPFSIWEHGD